MRLPALLLAAATLGAAADAPRPYLADVPPPDLLAVLPPPPSPGSPLDQADRAIFRETRALRNTPRWAIATADVTDDRFTTFACAMGMKLDTVHAPALSRVFARLGGGDLINRVKGHYAKRRPYLDNDQPICEPKTAHLAANGDYPSGHTVSGWSTALILAELMPARATAILERGRMTGESRFICGSHSYSAVQAGYMAATALVATLHASPEFRRDMDNARQELTRLHIGAPPPADRCALEVQAEHQSDPLVR